MYKVFGDVFSGNCYKIKLLLELLELPYQWQHVDIMNGESRSQSFLSINPNGKIPALCLQSGENLWESNAILNYLAEGTRFLPDSKLERARVLQWQFFEQYSHEPYVAVARYISRYLGMPESRREEYFAKHEGGYKALTIMENHLSKCDFFVGDKASIADISLYAYTHVADEGGFELDRFPRIKAWLARIETLPHYVPMA